MIGQTKLRRTATPRTTMHVDASDDDDSYSDNDSEFSFDGSPETRHTKSRINRVSTPAPMLSRNISDYDDSSSLDRSYSSITKSPPKARSPRTPHRSFFSSILSVLPFGSSPMDRSPSYAAIQRAREAAKSRHSSKHSSPAIGHKTLTASRSNFKRAENDELVNQPKQEEQQNKTSKTGLSFGKLMSSLGLSSNALSTQPTQPVHRKLYQMPKPVVCGASTQGPVYSNASYAANRRARAGVYQHEDNYDDVPSMLSDTISTLTTNTTTNTNVNANPYVKPASQTLSESPSRPTVSNVASTGTQSVAESPSVVRKGLVASVIAKMAQADAVARERAARRKAQLEEGHKSQLNQGGIMRLLGPRANADVGDTFQVPERTMQTSIDEDVYFHYEKTLDPELLHLESVLIDALQTLHLLEHEFGVYGNAFSSLGAQATKLSRTTHQVHLQQQRRLRNEGMALGTTLHGDDDDDDDDDVWGLCDAEGRPLHLTKTTVTNAGKDMNARTKFIRSQTRMAEQAHRVFALDYKRELHRLALAWKGECQSYEMELKRGESHYTKLRQAVFDIEELEPMVAQLRSVVELETTSRVSGRGTSAEIRNRQELASLTEELNEARNDLHIHSVMYDGIIQGLKSSIATFTGAEGAIDKFLELTMTAQREFFRSATGNDTSLITGIQKPKLSIYAGLMNRKKVVAPKANDFFFGSNASNLSNSLLSTPKRSDGYYHDGACRYRAGHGPKRDVMLSPGGKRSSSGKVDNYDRDCQCSECVNHFSASTMSLLPKIVEDLAVLDEPTSLLEGSLTPPHGPRTQEPAGGSANISGIPPCPYIAELAGGSLPPTAIHASSIPPCPYIPELMHANFIPPAPLLDLSSLGGIQPVHLTHASVGLLGAIKKKGKQERDADEVAKLGISAVPNAQTLLQCTGLTAGMAKLKVVHWESIDVAKLKDSIWQDVASMLNPDKIDLDQLITQTEVEEEFIEEDMNDDNDEDTMIVTQRIRKVKPVLDKPKLEFGLLTEQDIIDISLLFSQASTKTRLPTHTDDSTTTGKSPTKQVALIDAKRSYAVTISLAQLRLPYNHVVDMVLSLSDALPHDKLSVLLNILPTNEEMKQVRAFKGDRSILGESEKFFLTISDAEDVLASVIDNTSNGVSSGCYEQCLRAMIYMRDFADWARNITDQLDTTTNALTAIKETPQTKMLLLAALSVGNLLNCEHNTKSGAYGFRLGDLMKLNGIKANVDILKQDKKDKIVEETQDDIGNIDGDLDEAEEDRKQAKEEAEVKIRQLSADFQDLPMPKQPNLTHFICKLLIRRDPLLCPGLSNAAEAFLSASRFEQNSVMTSVHQLSGQMKRVSSLLSSISVYRDVFIDIITSHGLVLDEDGVIIDRNESPPTSVDTPINLTIAKASLQCIRKLSAFVAYADLRVAEINTQSFLAQELAVELATLLLEPDAASAWEILLNLWGGFLKILSGAYTDILTETARRETIRKRLAAADALQHKRRNSKSILVIPQLSPIASNPSLDGISN